MLRLMGCGSRLCDGITRRELMQVGTISTLGLALPQFLDARSEASQAAGRRSSSEPTAKAVILINLLGGPSHIDMFDMKPRAPVEIRGEFKPIATSVPGLQICEYLPLTAKTMHRSALIRTHSHLYNTHSPYNLLTGYSGPVIVDNVAKLTDHPCIGSVMQHVGVRSEDVPSFVWMPSHPGHSQTKRRAGPYGGFLGKMYDPLFTTYTPRFEGKTDGRNIHIDPPTPIADPQLPAIQALPDLSARRFDRRRTLLEQLDRVQARLDPSRATETLGYFQRKALSLLASSKTRDAFDLAQEPDSVRQRYGRNLFGSCMLTARRLVESGVKFVGVTTESQIGGGVGAGQWDTHGNNFRLLKNFNLPVLDQNYTALIEDLDERGLLESTLVVLMGEMGRTPRVNKRAGGRDHWTQCGFIVLTGGGVKQGIVYGKSDKHGAWPTEHPVSSADHVATIYELLGIDPHAKIRDRSGRAIPIALDGDPIRDVIA